MPTKYTAYNGTSTQLTTGLNSLANNTNSAATADIDNDTDLEMFADIALVLGTQTSRTGTPLVKVYITHSIDAGTNFSDLDHTTSELICALPVATGTAAQRVHRTRIPIPPGEFRVFLRNETSQAFNASGNTLTIIRYSVEST